MINTLSEDPSGDELDVLAQAEAVEGALCELGYRVRRHFCGLDLESTRSAVGDAAPGLVFNLVETLGGKGSLIHLVPSLLESMAVPFTGSSSYALMVTTDKVRTKKILKANRIPTPDWFLPGSAARPDPEGDYMLKPVWEDGSAGITDSSVMKGGSGRVRDFLDQPDVTGQFLETYIEGREFNLSLLAGPGGPEALPAAEMQYVDYPEGKPRILNFASKWDPGSFEYSNTIRTFDLPAEDGELVRQMKVISLRCWDLFELRGYARVDFRVDALNRPLVLEVNANPCIAPDAGFVAACTRGGISYRNMIERIVSDIPHRLWKK